MKHNRKTAATLSGIGVLATAAASWVFFTYLPVSTERLSLTIGCIVCGVIISAIIYLFVTILPNHRMSRSMSIALFFLVVAAPFFSAIFPRITHARFGFTVFGAIPIPFLDITVNRNGLLWFRPKTHLITKEEIESIITKDVEVVIVGIGWESVAKLSDDAKALGEKIDLRVMSTPEAFALYNKLKGEGRVVVLLAHSTC